MPAQKRSHDSMEDDPLQNHHELEPEGQDDSDGSASSSSEEKEEFILVKLAEIRKEVQCPICLGIIRKTRTVMECLHRFCRECIDKSMRLGNNECPACRTHCASRRSLRDDPNYDALIAALYPDIDKYEEEELAFHEEERARNKQIQDSIAQTLQRQSEALGRKRNVKATTVAVVRRSQSAHRRRRNYRATEPQSSEDDEDLNENGGKDSSSTDERFPEAKPKRFKRWGGGHCVQASSAAASAEGRGEENDPEVNRDVTVASVGLVSSSERLAWGKGGMRSHTRYGSLASSNGKNVRGGRLSKMVDHLRNLEENDDQLDIHLGLISFDEQKTFGLHRPFLCCQPTLSVGHLCKYIALQMHLQANEVELLLVKGVHSKFNVPPFTGASISNTGSVDSSCKVDDLQILEAQETLGGIHSGSKTNGTPLLLAYRRKVPV